jgi:hypothetical protein
VGGVYTYRRTNHNAIRTVSRQHNGAGLATIATSVDIPCLEAVTSYRSSDPSGGLTSSEILYNNYQAYAGLRTKYDNGHEFDHTVQTVKFPSQRVNVKASLINPQTHQPDYLSFAGPLALIAQPGDFASIPDIDISAGAKAIQLTRPTNPTYDIFQALAQIKSEIPRGFIHGLSFDWETNIAKTLSKNAGKAWLSYEFGFDQFVQDLQGVLQAVVTSNKVLKQYLKDSGKPVRRKHYFKPVVTTVQGPSVGSSVPHFIGLNSAVLAELFAGGSTGVTTTYVDKTTKKVWFSGEYMYYLDKGNSAFDKVDLYGQLAAKLLGPGVTVSTLYEVAPWSWLVDWFLNLGVIIDNGAAFAQNPASLVLRYGYLMQETVVERTYTVTGLRFSQCDPGPVSQQFISKRQQRVRATPYGFGSNPATWTAFQWSILLALGLAKQKGELY